MLGIFTGMRITLKHLFGPKVTRLYPYEKRKLPPRMRGLIHYLRDDKGQFKCEGCLFCEKICPPQAITVSFKQRETHRDRPLTLPQAVWGNFRRSRRSLLSHQGRPELAVTELAPQAGEPAVDWQRVAALVESDRGANAGLAAALAEIQATVGYLPRHAVSRLASESGVDLSAAYALATGAPGFRTTPASGRATDGAVAVCQCPVCRNAGADEIAAAVSAEMAAGGRAYTTAAPHARCLGDSRQAPVLRIDGRRHGGLTAESAARLVREFVTVGGLPR